MIDWASFHLKSVDIPLAGEIAAGGEHRCDHRPGIVVPRRVPEDETWVIGPQHCHALAQLHTETKLDEVLRSRHETLEGFLVGDAELVQVARHQYSPRAVDIRPDE